MKKLVVFVAVAAALVFYLYHLGQRKPPPEPRGESVATPAPARTAAPPRPAPAAPQPRAPQTISHPDIDRLARAARVQLVKFEDRGAKARVVVQWVSDVSTQGMDFIEKLLFEGIIRDIDINSQQLETFRTNDGRRGYRMSIDVMM